MNLAEATQSNLAKLSDDPTISQFLGEVKEWGSTIIVGGALRDWCFGKQPRDIDLIVDCSAETMEALSKYRAHKNRFGGYKLTINRVEFDIWNLSSTWAFGNDSNFSKKMDTIPETVFLNLDAVIYYLDTGAVVDKGFSQTIESKTLDIMYEPNPYPFLCASKSLAALKKYELKASHRLREFVREQESKGYNQKSFNRYQKLQYGSDTIFDFSECMNRV